ncbi:ecdysone oxidase-like [Cydia fagiglandana]|uniref:ecdysone oxidase-like n=1 Tax=Cydia fagiglandana TaxID=1458189 RepID=UPI002FEE4E04
MSACGGGGVGGGGVGSAVAAALHFFAASQCLVREEWLPDATVHNGSTWDFIVVGGGTAGAALAARLPGAVLLLEAGGDPPQESIIPGFRHHLKGSEYDWNFTSVDDAVSSQALINGQQLQPRGKTLGGSGSINDMVYARGFPADYEEWASLVGEQWNWTNVLKYFKKTEHLTDEKIINDPELMEYHGRNGDIEVTGLNESMYTTTKFLEAFEELGFPIVKDMTYPGLIGAGRFSHTIRDGQRDSSLTAMLNKQSWNEKLKVVKNALVTKILIENDKAYGVEALINGDSFTFLVDKEVVVSAGTFNTAKLLMLSGLGPKEHLEEMEIEVIKDLPVGDNLHDHVMVLTYLAADNGTCFYNEAESQMELIRYLYDRTGSYSRTDSMGAYITNKDGTVPEFAIYPSCISVGENFYQNCVNMLGFQHKICTQLQSELESSELLGLAVVLLKPKSRGKVRLKSADPLEAPLIYSGTFCDISDLDGFPSALQIAWSIANTSYFRAVNARVIELDIDYCNNIGTEDLKCKAQAMATSAWHAVGTAAMGSVLDSRLKVRGVRGLRVADASVMPKVVRGNTNAPVIMIAERAADFIKEEYFGL